MAPSSSRRSRSGGRRPAGGALTRTKILDAAVTLLDEAGVAGCTFRELSERLKTGAGAIYWHVADKDAMLGGAADTVLADVTLRGSGADAVRSGAVAVFDAVAAHPWLTAVAARDDDVSALADLARRIRTSLTETGHTESRSRAAVAAAFALAMRLGSQSAHDPLARATLLEGVDLIAGGLSSRVPTRTGLTVTFTSGR